MNFTRLELALKSRDLISIANRLFIHLFIFACMVLLTFWTKVDLTDQYFLQNNCLSMMCVYFYTIDWSNNKISLFNV